MYFPPSALEKMRCLLAMASLCVVGLAFSQSTESKFKSVKYQPAENSPIFVFSSGNATAADPIRIAVAGRKLTNEDRVYRVELQKHWVSLHAPKGHELRMRTMSECGLRIVGEYPYCDLYSLVDPKTGNALELFIYIGNWP